MKKIFMLLLLVIAMIFPSTYPASAAATWSTSSPDDSYNRPELVSQYDLVSVGAAIFDNDSDFINFYLYFRYTPKINQFNDGTSFALVSLDYNLDGEGDYEIYTEDIALTTDRSSVKGYVYRVSDKSFPKCDVDVFTNIDVSKVRRRRFY